MLQIKGFLVLHTFAYFSIYFIAYLGYFIVPNIDLPSICSPKFKPGPPADSAQVLSERLNDVLMGFVISGYVFPV